MEENREVVELLRQIEKTSRQQARSARLHCILTFVSALCCVAVLVTVLGILPKVDGVITQMDAVLSNLEQTTAQLAAIDLQGMVSDVDALVTTGQQSLQQTMEKVNAIDYESLNRAIKDLADVIEPLAKFFNAFR